MCLLSRFAPACRARPRSRPRLTRTGPAFRQPPPCRSPRISGVRADERERFAVLRDLLKGRIRRRVNGDRGCHDTHHRVRPRARPCMSDARRTRTICELPAPQSRSGRNKRHSALRLAASVASRTHPPARSTSDVATGSTSSCGTPSPAHAVRAAGPAAEEWIRQLPRFPPARPAGLCRSTRRRDSLHRARRSGPLARQVYRDCGARPRARTSGCSSTARRAAARAWPYRGS